MKENMRENMREHSERTTLPMKDEKSTMAGYGGKYGKFAAMSATSTLVIFGLMYLNTYRLDHIYFSETRAYMAVVMGAAIALILPIHE